MNENDFQKDLLQNLMPEPKVSRNKNKKTISVSNAFDFGRIPIKIIAPYEEWIRIEEKFIENEFSIELEAIKPYLSRPLRRIVLELEKHSKEHPDDFAEHFYYYYIAPSKDANPLVTRKPRGGSPYGLPRSEMWEIKTAARHLYVYLLHWLRKDEGSYPSELKTYLAEHDMTDLENIRLTTKEIIQEHFEIRLTEHHDDFYDKYIAYQKLDNLKKAYQKRNYSLFAPPLLRIFRDN